MMHAFIKMIGSISVGLGLAGLIFGAYAIYEGSQGLVPRLILGPAFAALLSGAILHCFGAIVEHLIAIRRNTEAQLQIFQDRLGG
ncbi:MAG: hypothetical protein KF810_22990 [Rhizobiaceae bacterium]|nr:hypothetical protein [Rhizobiaceae bacterium]